MPDIILIIWLPLAISFMAVAWVVTLGALGRQAPLATEEPVARMSPPAGE